MQLEEQGKLNLDADINQYLDFPIRPAFNKPITLRNLMTHTAGFEETLNEIIITDPKQAVSLRDYLIANQPMRIYPPGRFLRIPIMASAWQATLFSARAESPSNNM